MAYPPNGPPNGPVQREVIPLVGAAAAAVGLRHSDLNTGNVVVGDYSRGDNEHVSAPIMKV